MRCWPHVMTQGDGLHSCARATIRNHPHTRLRAVYRGLISVIAHRASSVPPAATAGMLKKPARFPTSCAMKPNAFRPSSRRLPTPGRRRQSETARACGKARHDDLSGRIAPLIPLKSWTGS
jgi:hypothetical protein